MFDPDDVDDTERDALRTLRKSAARLGGSLDALEGLGLHPVAYRQIRDEACDRWDADEYEPRSVMRVMDAYSFAYEDPEEWITAGKDVVSLFDNGVDTETLAVPTPAVAGAMNRWSAECAVDLRPYIDPDAPYAADVKAPEDVGRSSLLNRGVWSG